MNLKDIPIPRTRACRARYGACWKPREHSLLFEMAQIEREATAWKAVAEMYRNCEGESTCNAAFDNLKQQLEQQP